MASGCLLLVMVVTTTAQAEFTYTTNSEGASITGYTGQGGAVTIPSEMAGLPVVRIEERAFLGMTSLSSVTIPEGVSSIGRAAFSGCSGLQSVSLPQGLASIDDSAFQSCRSLATITLPEGTARIGWAAFRGCSKLTSIAIPAATLSIGASAFSGCWGLVEIAVDPANPAYASVDGILHDRGLTKVIRCPEGRAGSIRILDSVTVIGAGAFEGCSKLTRVTLPDSVSAIEGSAFASCIELVDITLPGSVRVIGDSAFLQCTKLTRIELPPSVVSLGAHAFHGCTALTRFSGGSGVTRIEDFTFARCISLTTVTLPSRVTEVGDWAFYHCTSLREVVIPDRVESLGNGAFNECSALTSVYCLGPAPSAGTLLFSDASQATIYYVAGSGGWSAGYAGRPTAAFVPASVPPLVISPCHPITDPRGRLALSSAWDGSKFLLGLREEDPTGTTAGAAFFSPTGTAVSSRLSTGRTMSGFLASPLVAWGADRFLLVWTDAGALHPATGDDVYARCIGPTGVFVSDPVVLSGAGGDQTARGVAFDGTHFVGIWASASGLRGRRLTPAGGLWGEEFEVTTAEVEEAACVAAGQGQALVAWVEGHDGAHACLGRFLSSDGGLGSVLPLSQHPSFHDNPVSVAFGAGRFLVVWHHNADADADWNLRGRLVRSDGTMASEELVLTDGPKDEFAWAGNVAFDGQHFLVVWSEFVGSPATGQGTALGRYWTTQGTPAGDPFVVSPPEVGQLVTGASPGAGGVLATINIRVLSPDPEVCVRLITRPFVQMDRPGPEGFAVRFGGVLQSSTNLSSWQNLIPQPASPWMPPAGSPALFLRAVAGDGPGRHAF